MDASTLLEYDRREWEQVNQTLLRLQGGGFKEVPAHRLFYPEFIQNTESKIVSNALNGGLDGALFLQLPFYDAVALPIMAADEDTFTRTYRLSVDQLLQLAEKGKVLVMLDSQPSLYAGLDYLDPILEKYPPSFQIREVGFENYTSIFTQNRSVNSVIANSKPYIIEKMRFWNEFVGSESWSTATGPGGVRALAPSRGWSSYAAEAGISLTETVYQLTSWDFDLTRAGYGELLPAVVQSKLPKLAQAAGLFTLRTHLYMIPSFAMDGVLATDEKSWPWSFYRSYGISGPEFSVFPVDIAKQLIEKFHLLDIRDVGTEKIIDITSDTARARRALLGLQEAVNKGNPDILVDSADAVADKIKEANKAIESMVTTKEKTAKYLPMVLGVLGGAAAALGGLPTIVAGMFGGFVSTLPLVDKVGSILARRGKPGYVVALYDLQQSIAQGSS